MSNYFRNNVWMGTKNNIECIELHFPLFDFPDELYFYYKLGVFNRWPTVF